MRERTVAFFVSLVLTYIEIFFHKITFPFF